MMKKIVITGLILFISILSFSQKKSALFLGNSYTYVNDLPSMCVQIANSMGDTLTVDQNTPGGYTLEGHSTNSTSLSKIASQPWDFVVLQGQSQRPAFPQSQVEVEVYPYAEILCDSIYSNDSCSMPLFFMTWGRENGDQSNCANYPPLCTYEGMQLELRKSYLKMAQDNDASVAPVGMVWKAFREDYPDVNLYSNDGSHPSLYGTFLAANVFYTSMFHKSPIGAYVPSGIDATQAELIQTYSSNVVFDSLDVWQIDTTQVRAKFQHVLLTKRSHKAYFFNFSENGEWFEWDFGDNSPVYVQESVYEGEITHDYPAVGYYTVCLTAWRGCESDTYCENVYSTPSGISVDDDCNPQLQYDAVSGRLSVDPKLVGKRLWIYDALGRLIDTQKIHSTEMQLSTYSGVVILKVQGVTSSVVSIGE